MPPASRAAASNPAVERTLCRDRPHASTPRQAPAATPSPGWARGPLLAPVSVAARRLLLVSPAPAASSLPVEQMPCWDRLNAPAARQAPAAAPSPDLARGPLLVPASVSVVAWRPLLVSPAPAVPSLSAERMPCWDRRDAPAERQAPVVALSPGLAWGSVLAAAPVPPVARRQLLVLLAPAASSLPAERTPCWDRRDAAAQRPVPAELPLPRLVRAAAVVWEPAAARRQRGPAAPNQAAARRPCSDPYDAVAQQRAAARARVPQQARLQAQGWMLEQTAAMQARLAPARYFREQRLLA